MSDELQLERRVEELEAERDKYKKALAKICLRHSDPEIANETLGWLKTSELWEIVKEADDET